MRKLIVLTAIIFSTVIVAQEKKSKNKQVEFKVNGNCEMCEKRIEKAAFSVKGVKSADWHIEHHDIHLIIDENKCSVEDVKRAIAKAGHDTEDIKATDEDYQKLHSCCKYERL